MGTRKFINILFFSHGFGDIVISGTTKEKGVEDKRVWERKKEGARLTTASTSDAVVGGGEGGSPFPLVGTCG